MILLDTHTPHLSHRHPSSHHPTPPPCSRTPASRRRRSRSTKRVPLHHSHASSDATPHHQATPLATAPDTYYSTPTPLATTLITQCPYQPR
ncbi:hypothetical protein Pcinc_006106 [Petrolisthes cinctipes]|uniref:Uncharacterized protein n=1 Tax=Petrolisthes cinctipes TaxID=88211 RepID=A0AAE1GDW1_PETCI|nr:hypothetical protein Pcinc_006106 [Petrolisthes cinctipes]